MHTYMPFLKLPSLIQGYWKRVNLEIRFFTMEILSYVYEEVKKKNVSVIAVKGL
jgi:hypothetical protein